MMRLSCYAPPSTDEDAAFSTITATDIDADVAETLTFRRLRRLSDDCICIWLTQHPEMMMLVLIRNCKGHRQCW